MEQYLLSQDIGVFSCKASLFRLDGTQAKYNQITYTPCYGDEGSATQSSQLWWDAFCQNCKTLLEGIDPQQVIAVCVCGQMMGCLPLDGAGNPLMDSIIWDDIRATEQSKALLRAIDQEELHATTGILSPIGYAATSFMWLRDNLPHIYQQADKLMQCKDYINYLLCGEIATDYSDAGFTQLFDLKEKCWSEKIIHAAGLDPAKLPQVRPHGTILGTVSPEASHQCGLSPSTQVVLGMGDGRTVLVGSGMTKKGDGCIHLSATSWISQVTDSPEVDATSTLSKTSYLTPDLYTNGGTMLCGRLSAEWLLREFGGTNPQDAPPFSFEAVDEQLAHTVPGCRGLLFMPYLRGERVPWWNNLARGAFLGLRSNHTRYDFCRSVLEGVGFNLGVIKSKIDRLAPFEGPLHMVGTCSESAAWRQILADICDRPIVVSDVRENVGCVGCALIAGVAIGVFDDYSDIEKFHTNPITIYPIEENVLLYRELLPAFEDCYYALSEINHHLSRF